MNKEVSIAQLKAKASEYVKQVERTKKPIQITRRGKPAAQLAPVLQQRRKSIIGSMKGRMKITGDIVSPVIDLEDFEVFRD